MRGRGEAITHGVALLAGLALGALFADSGSRDASPPSSPPVVPGAASPAGPVRSLPAAPGTIDVLAPPPAAERTADAPRPAPGEFRTRLRVTCRARNGARIDGAFVYAIPAGQPGGAPDELPGAWWRREPVEIPLARGGRFDVGARAGLLHALARDVGVTEGGVTDVVLEFPDAAPAVFRLEAPPPDLPAGADSLGVELSAIASTVGRRVLPGREEGIDPGNPVLDLPVRPGAELRTDPIPEGAELAFRISPSWDVAEHGARPVPSPASGRIRSGATVTIGWTETVPFRVHVTEAGLPWPDSRPEPDIRVSADEGGWIHGTPLRDADGAWNYRAAPGRVSVRIGEEGADAAAGMVKVVDVRAGVPVDVEFDLPEAVAVAEDPEEGVVLEFEGSTEPIDPDRVAIFASPPGDGSADDSRRSRVEVRERDGALRAILPRDGRVTLHAFGPGSRLTAATRVAGQGPTTLRFEEGGFVALYVEEELPDGVGALEVRDAAGRPIPHRPASPLTDELPVGFDPAVPASRGSTWLGPFPPGRRRFLVSLGRSAYAEVEALVEAGRHAVVPVRR